MGRAMNMSGGGGMKINGIEKEYSISPGKSVLAGDFVTMVPGASFNFANGLECARDIDISIERIDSDRYILCFMNPSNYLIAAVYTFSTNTYVTTQLTTTAVYRPRLRKLKNGTYVVMYGKPALACSILQINSGNTVSMTEKVIGSNVSQGTTWVFGDFIELSDGRLFASHIHNFSSPLEYYWLKVTLITITNNTPALTASNFVAAGEITDSLVNPGMVELSPGRVLIGAQRAGGNERILYSILSTVSGNTISSVYRYEEPSFCGYSPYVAKISETIGVIFAQGTNGYLFGNLIPISGSTLGTRVKYQLSTKANTGQVSGKVMSGGNRCFLATIEGPIRQYIINFQTNVPVVESEILPPVGTFDTPQSSFVGMRTNNTVDELSFGYNVTVNSKYYVRLIFIRDYVEAITKGKTPGGVSKKAGIGLSIVPVIVPNI